MVRRMVCVLAAAVLAVGLRLPAGAAENSGSIRIAVDYGDSPVEGGAVVLYCVAEPAEGGYRLGERFGGGIIRQEDACSPELARWLAERAASGGVRQSLDPEGGTVFSGLEEGLYLAVQTEAPEGWYCAMPFLIPIPLDGEWEVLAYPKLSALLTESPKTGQHPAPLFAAMGLVLSGTGLYFCLEKLRKK